MPWGLFSDKAQLEITLDQPAYKPGIPIRARITVRGTQEQTVQAGQIELRYDNTYTYRTTHRDSKGSRHTASSTDTDARTVASQQFWNGGTLTNDSLDEYDVEFRLPEQVPPTGKGELCEVRWSLHAFLDIANAFDVKLDVPVIVQSPRDQYAQWARDALVSNGPDDCRFTFAIANPDVRPGETIAGTIQVAPTTAFDATDVRIELMRREEVPRDQGNTYETTIERIEVARAVRFEPGIAQTFPFQITLPPDVCPSLHTDNAAVHWGLKAVVARAFRSDPNAIQEINVYTGSAAYTGATQRL